MGGAKHLTRLFSCHAARTIKAAQSLSAARELLRISPWQLQAIREWAVEYGLRHRSQDEEHVLLGIDEKSFGKRQNFVTIVYSHTKRCVIDIVPGRSAEAAACALRQAIPEKQRASVKGVSMDFSTAYAKAVAEVLPDARQVVDKFHAMALLGKAVDEIRRAVVRSPQCPDVLKDTRHLWLKDRCHLTEKELRVLTRSWSLITPSSKPGTSNTPSAFFTTGFRSKRQKSSSGFGSAGRSKHACAHCYVWPRRFFATTIASPTPFALAG